MSVTLNLLKISDRATRALRRLETEFPSGYKLTFVARHTTNPDAQVVITSDDPELVAQAVLRRSKSFPRL